MIDTCDTARLSSDPRSIDATLRTYVEATKQLLAVAREADTALRDACLEIYKDPALGIVPPIIPEESPAKGAAACQPLIQRIVPAVEKQPDAPGLNVLPPWILLQFGQRCAVPVGAREACLAGCAGACDVSKCESLDKTAGRCPGECLGTCTTIASDLADPDGGIPCKGTCIGEVPLPNRGGATPGATCLGECTGTCGAGIYTGNCEGSCSLAFTGICAGTCHGTCNGNPLTETTPPRDAGAPDAAVDAAAQPTDPPPPLNDNPGNCGKGICEGSCSHGANGSCFGGRCVSYTDVDGGAYTTSLAGFSAGECTNSVCVGTCRSALGTGSVTASSAIGLFAEKCRGECTELTVSRNSLRTNTACTGTCRKAPDSDAGSCSVELDPTTTICEGRLDCGQNIECSNACEAKAALDSVCVDPLVLQVYAVTDPPLHKALQTYGRSLGKAVALLRKAQTAYSFIGGRNYGDFVSLGGADAGVAFPSRGALAVACANEGAVNVAAANEILGPDTAADPTIVRTRK